MRKIVNLFLLLMVICSLILSSCGLVDKGVDDESGTVGDQDSSGNGLTPSDNENNGNTGDNNENAGNNENENNPGVHKHDYTVVERVDPTEKKIGYSYKICNSCGSKETEYLKPTAKTVEQPKETLSEFSLKSSEQALIDAKIVFERVKSAGTADIFSMPMMNATEYMVVREFTLELIKDCTTETEKARTIYDWIVNNIEYDAAYTLATVYKTFTDKKAVCFGFTALMHDMLAAADILSVYASGITDSMSVENLDYYYVFDPVSAPSNISHAWVIFYADGKAVCCDPTWGDFYESYDRGYDLSPDVISKTHLITNINALTVIPDGTDVRLYRDAYCLAGNRIFFISNGELGNLAPAGVMQNSIEYNMIPYAMERESEHDIPNAVTSNGFFRLFDSVDKSDESYWYYALPDGRSYQYSTVLSFVMSMNHLCGKSISIEKMDEFILHDGLVYRDKGNCLTVYTSVGVKTSVTVPATVNGKPVKVIGPGAFQDNGIIKEIIISDGIEEIAHNAFFSAINLESIKLPSTLKKIGNSAFYDNLLVEMELPEGVTEIGQNIFSYQRYLKSVTLPASYAPEKFTHMFSMCPLLESVKVASGSIFTSVEGVLFGDGGKSLLVYPCGKTDKTYVIPEGVTHITGSAFEYCNLENIVFPSTLVSIGESAFFGSTALTEISIPATVTTIRPMAFSGCDALIKAIIPDSVESIAAVFQQCLNLKEVYIGKNVSDINQAFLMSPSIEKVIISDENKYFKTVEGVIYSADGKTLVYYPSGKAGDVLYVLEGTKSLGIYAFDSTELKTIVLPEGFEILRSTAFLFNKNLIALVLPSTIKNMPSLPVLAKGGVVYCSFAKDEVKSGVVIPNYVTAYYLGEWEFVNGEPRPIA